MRHFNIKSLVKDIGLKLMERGSTDVNFLMNRRYFITNLLADSITKYTFIPNPSKEQLLIGNMFGDVTTVTRLRSVFKDNIVVRLSVVSREIYLLSMMEIEDYEQNRK